MTLMNAEFGSSNYKVATVSGLVIGTVCSHSGNDNQNTIKKMIVKYISKQTNK